MGLRLLRFVRVLGTRVDFELLQQLTAEAILGEHAPHRSLDHTLGVLVEPLACGLGLQRPGSEASITTQSRVISPSFGT